MFKFNQETEAMIYQMFDGQANHTGIVKLISQGYFARYISTIYRMDKLFIDDNLNWIKPTNPFDIKNFNDASLIMIHKHLDKMFQLNMRCLTKQNAFGLIKIWIKILQSEQINTDLSDCLKKEYVFQPNPENMQVYINEVESELSESALLNLVFP
jgi:hypothetical protein